MKKNGFLSYGVEKREAPSGLYMGRVVVFGKKFKNLKI